MMDARKTLGTGTILLILFVSVAAEALATTEVIGEAAALYRSGKPAKALNLLRQAIADDPSDIDAHLAFSRMRILIGEREAVRREYRAIVEKNPADRVTLLVQVTLMPRSGLRLSAFQKLLRDEPEYARAWEEYGVALLESMRPREATAALGRAVALAPERAHAHLYLGLARRALDEREAEEREIRRALAIDPGDVLSRLEMAKTACNGGDLAEAEDLLAGLQQDLGDEAEVLAYLSWVKNARGKKEGAQRIRERILRENGAILEDLLSQGIRERSAQQLASAERTLRLAVYLDSSFVEAYMQLGILYRVANDPDRAIETYKKALLHGDLNQLAWRNLGISYADKGDHESAEKYIRRSLEVNPDYLIGWVDLGRTLAKLGKTTESIDVWKKVEAMAPYGWEAKTARHYIHYLEKGEEIPPMNGGTGGWKPPSAEEIRKAREKGNAAGQGAK